MQIDSLLFHYLMSIAKYVHSPNNPTKTMKQDLNFVQDEDINQSNNTKWRISSYETLRRRNFVVAAIAKPKEWGVRRIEDIAIPCDGSLP